MPFSEFSISCGCSGTCSGGLAYEKTPQKTFSVADSTQRGCHFLGCPGVRQDEGCCDSLKSLFYVPSSGKQIHREVPSNHRTSNSFIFVLWCCVKIEWRFLIPSPSFLSPPALSWCSLPQLEELLQRRYTEYVG